MTGCGRVGRKDFAIPTLTEVEGEESKGRNLPSSKDFVSRTKNLVIPTEGRNLLSCAPCGILAENSVPKRQPRSGERMQPTAQAVGGRAQGNQPRRGERN